MTIFLEIIKVFLLKEITEVRNISVAKERSTVNFFLTKVKLGRDKTLSETKQTYADKLMMELRLLEDVKTDELTFLEIKRLISDCKNNVQEISTKAGYGEGKFGPAMDKIVVFLGNIYEKLKKVGLLDFQHDNDYLNMFRFHMAYYFANKVNEARNPSFITWLTQHPKVTRFHELTQEKEEKIVLKLAECKDDLNALDERKKDYNSKRKKCVLQCINQLKNENAALCKEHGSNVQLPIHISYLLPSASIDMPTIGPEVGILGVCLEVAKNEIENKTASNASLSTKKVAKNENEVKAAAKKDPDPKVEHPQPAGKKHVVKDDMVEEPENASMEEHVALSGKRRAKMEEEPEPTNFEEQEDVEEEEQEEQESCSL